MAPSEPNATHALIFSLNSEGKLTCLYGTAAAATGWQLGQAIQALGADHQGLIPAVEAAMKGEVGSAAITLAEKTYSLRLIPQPTGHPDGHGVIALSYESEQSQLDQMTSRFISMITHRFRNPLTVINTTTFLLERYDTKLESAKKKEYFDKIRTQVSHLDGLIDQVMIVHGKSDHIFAPEPLDLSELAQSAMSQAQAMATPAHQLHLTISGDLHYPGDPKLLTDMLLHLLVNAIKFSPAGGDINLCLRRDPEAICIEVADHGLGIPQADLTRIGQPFFRASNATYMQGSGLGLRIATMYAEQHGGSLDFSSVEGQGSLFTVRLPASQS